MEENNMFHKLSDDYLIDAYIRAVSLGLDPYFIFLIEKELSKRGLSSIQSQSSNSTVKVEKVYKDRNQE